MDFNNIFLASFYILLGVLFIVIVVPALYSMFGKKKPSVVHTHGTEQTQARLTVVNSDSVNVANLAALTSSGSVEPTKMRNDYTTKVKTQEIKKAPRQPKFEVFNPAQELGNQSGHQPSAKNWSSHWN